MISIENLSVEFSAKPLFSNISFVINKNDRIALVGKNGAGKSTMLKILAGIQSPTSGQIGMPKGLTIGYLPQVMVLSDSLTVKEETEKAFTEFAQLEENVNKLTCELAERTDYESESYHKLIDRLTEANELLAMHNPNSREASLERTLIGLGFERKDFDRPTSEFSGGWRMRIELAKILLQKPDVLLLDEPTNHLDIESIQWLEKFLTSQSVTIVLISHDRAFLDNVTKRTIEITCGTIHDYDVNYSKYVVLHKERIEQQKRAYENQQKMLADTQAFIERFRYQATKATQVQSRIKQLEKVELIEIDEVDNSRLNLKFAPAPRSGDFPVICDNVSKSYGDHLIFKDASFRIRRGEKVAFVGRNGEGKSTMVKCILNEIPFDGDLKVGHGVKIGYFAQNQAQLLDENLTVFDTIDRVAQGDMRTKIRDILGAFMFGGEASDKKVKVLSGGERSRLAMIKLLLEPVNLLILDEPTNHLDMVSKDVLKQAIQAFDGTVILVSHDRSFLDGLVEKIYEFKNQQVKEHLCGIYEYLQKNQLEELNDLNRKDKTFAPAQTDKAASAKTAASTTAVSNAGEGALSFEEQKELKRQINKFEKAVSNAEQRIAEIEQKIADLEVQMTTPEGCSNVALFTEHANLKKQLDDVTDEWMTQGEALEELKSKFF